MQPNGEPQPGEDPEITAMKKIGAALAAMEDDVEARTRVLRWAVEKYRAKTPQSPGQTQVQTLIPTLSDTEATSRTGGWQDFPTMFNAASPETDPERALVIIRWLYAKANTTENRVWCGRTTCPRLNGREAE